MRRRTGTDAERDRSDASESEAVERERRGFPFLALGARARFVGDSRVVRRLLVLRPFAFRAAGLVVGLTGRGGGGGGAAERGVPEAEADVDDEADEPRLGPADTDASSSEFDSDVPEESERVIAGYVVDVGVQRGRALVR